jgi:hypothetical protein
VKMLLRTPAAAPVNGGSSARSGVFRTLAGAPEKAQRPSNGQEPAGDNFAHDGSIQAAGTRAADAGPTDRMCFEVASATTSSEKPRRRCAALRWPGRTAHTVEQKRGVH